MIRSILGGVVLVFVLAVPGRAAQWDPAAWAKEDTIRITTVAPDEGPHEFPVWLVVIDGQVYLRLGTRAADRLQKNTTNPYVGVKIAGQEFPKIRVQQAQDMEQRVAKAMSDKYTSDIWVRYFSHPMTVRLLNEQ